MCIRDRKRRRQDRRWRNEPRRKPGVFKRQIFGKKFTENVIGKFRQGRTIVWQERGENVSAARKKDFAAPAAREIMAVWSNFQTYDNFCGKR